MTLSPEDRALAIERAVSHIQGRYVERRILAAATDADAAAVAKDECHLWGSAGRYYRIGGHLDRRGLTVEVDGRSGLVRWAEIAHAVRGSDQLELFAA